MTFDSKVKFEASQDELSVAKKELHEIKTEMISNVDEKLQQLNIDKAPLNISISGKEGEHLKISVETAEKNFEVFSDSQLISVDALKNNVSRIDEKLLLKRFKALNDTEYYIEKSI